MAEAEKLDPNAIPREMQERRQLADELETKATEAFGRGELLTATLHASDLLMLFPNERRYLDKFDEIVLSTDDPLAILPVDTGSVHVATAAGRARVLMMGRRLPEALSLLCRAVDVAPGVPYLHWILRWLQPGIVETLEWPLLLDTAVKTALTLGASTPVPPERNDPRIPNLRAGADYLKAIRGAYPDESILWFGEALLRRRLGDQKQTIAVAEEAAQRFPQDWRVRTSLLNAYRDAERCDDALAQARIAMEIDPDDLSPLYDAAWAMLDGMRTGDAMHLFEELYQRDPGYPGAAACRAWSRWKSTRSEEDTNALVALRDRHPYDAQAREFADEVDPPIPYVNVLPGPADATANAARHFTRELAHVIRCCGLGGTIGLTVRAKHLDSPSVEMAFEVAMKALGANGTLTVEVEELQQPDPRGDKAPVSTPIWKYEGWKAATIYPEGDARAQEAIAGIARSVFRRESWDAAARQVAGQFGNEGYHALVSVLTHPPIPRDEAFDAFTWTWRCQVATAVVLSHLGGWEGGAARAALYSMIYGPSDWITAAAIVAFAWRAAEAQNVRDEAEPIFSWLRTIIPEKGYTPWEGALAESWLTLGHDEEKRTELKAWIRRYYESLPEKNVVRPPERQYGGLSLEEYAKFSAHRDRMLAKLGYQSFGAQLVSFTIDPPDELVELCAQWKVPLRHPDTGVVFPYINEWQEAMNANPQLHARFLEVQRTFALESMGVSDVEKAALDNILDGKMDVHERLAQQQAAQRELATDSDPDPVVFPGHPVERLSDYVGILREMQAGDMMGALSRRGLDMNAYTNVAQAWGAKLASDPRLTERFHRMMQG